jgi:hypothetical protein
MTVHKLAISFAETTFAPELFVPVVDRLPGWRILSITCPKMSLHTNTDVVLENSSMQKAFSCALPAVLNVTPLGRKLLRAHLAGDSMRVFLSIRTQDMDLALVVFVK